MSNMALVRLKAGNGTINVAGSFVIGILGGLGSRMGWSDSLQLALTVGLCGGFTTFSTFSKEAFSFATTGR
jgi:CrcB protein